MAEYMSFVDATRRQPSIFSEVDDRKLLAAPNQPWHVNALLGDESVSEAVKANNGVLNDAVIMHLFAQHPLPFYTDQPRQYLMVGHSELNERDFGPLTAVSSVEALMLFGLAKMEEANERGYVRL